MCDYKEFDMFVQYRVLLKLCYRYKIAFIKKITLVPSGFFNSGAAAFLLKRLFPTKKTAVE